MCTHASIEMTPTWFGITLSRGGGYTGVQREVFAKKWCVYFGFILFTFVFSSVPIGRRGDMWRKREETSEGVEREEEEWAREETQDESQTKPDCKFSHTCTDKVSLI